MHKIIATLPKAIIFGLLFSLLFLSDIYSQECGIERWRIKTVRDKDVKQIFWKAATTSVTEQVNEPREIQSGWLSAPRQPKELQLYKMSCVIIGLGKEKDNDYHMIIKDTKTGDHMIAEIPDPECSELKNTKLAPKYKQARDFIRKIYGEPSAIQKVKPTKIILYGVGFWEKMNHGQGHSKFGREIHPVVGIN